MKRTLKKSEIVLEIVYRLSEDCVQIVFNVLMIVDDWFIVCNEGMWVAGNQNMIANDLSHPHHTLFVPS